MTELKNVSQTQLTHTELAETADNYLKIIQTHLAGNAFLMNLVAIILPAVENMRSALAAIRTNALVKEAFALDQARDNLFILFRDLVAAYSKSDLPEEKEAHDQLWRIFEKVGTRLYDLGYLEQSGKLEVLFQEMDKEENQRAMETLTVTGRYNKLKTAEQAFKTLYNERLEEDAKRSYPTIKEARLALSPLVSDLLPTLRNIARTEEASPEGEATPSATPGTQPHWTALINEQTDRVMIQVAARRTRKGADEEGITE